MREITKLAVIAVLAGAFGTTAATETVEKSLKCTTESVNGSYGSLLKPWWTKKDEQGKLKLADLVAHGDRYTYDDPLIKGKIVIDRKTGRFTATAGNRLRDGEQLDSEGSCELAEEKIKKPDLKF